MENKKSVLILGVIVLVVAVVFALMEKGDDPDIKQTKPDITQTEPDIEQADPDAKQVVLVTTTKENDLVVNFIFDKEIVDIIFISPSGERLAIGDDGVAFADGDRWRTYRISDAEVGDWSIEYDLGENEFIDYSIIEDDFEI